MARQTLKFKNRQEWLTARGLGIGASEVATIVGLNPYETPYQLWRRKLGIDPPKQENFAMRAGHYLEDAVAMFFRDETGAEIIKASVEDFMYVNSEKPHLRVSPDRTYWRKGSKHNEENKCILECKTTQRSIDENDIPKYWFCQVQMNLGVAELEQGSLAWLCSGREFGYKDLKFVPDFFGWLSEEVDKFWYDCIQGKQEPHMSNVQDIMLRYNKHTEGKVVEVAEDVYAAYNDLKRIKDELAQLDEQKNALEDKLKLGFGDAEAISYCGQTLATWKAPKASEKFDSKAFKADHPDLYKEYTVDVQGARRFLLK